MSVQSIRVRRAQSEPLSAERIAPGMFEVSNLRSDSTHTVDIRGHVCSCPDFTYRRQARSCKHLEYIRGISDGVLCSHCGYELCRPSCPNKETRR